MKSRIIPILLACASASLARADFNPVALTPDSYTYAIVVPASYAQAVPYCINVTAGSGSDLGDNTYYEQGLYNRIGQVAGNSGIPIHNTVFTNINNANMTFLMPPDYTVNNELMIDSGHASGTLTFNTQTTANNLAILCCGGGGSLTVNYTVTHNDNSTETGTLSLPDWFNGGPTVAWGANGRMDVNGNYNNFNTSAVNNNPPYLYALQITVSDALPITSIEFDTPSGNHGNFYAVSGSDSGSPWTPIPLNQSSFNVRGTIPGSIPFPVTATMDQGTNLTYNGNLATWFEEGYVRNNSLAGLPPSGSTFSSQSQPSHYYQMGDYSTNNATLIDKAHQIANIKPASPAIYSAIAFLTAGGDVGGGNKMTNICIMQHDDGVSETNMFFGYDWFENGVPGAIAYESDGRVNLANRTVNAIGTPYYPYLFETYFLLQDTTSPVTNIVVKYGTSPSDNSTTFIMAVSATSGGVPPVVSEGPLPTSQTLYPSQTATFTVGLTGTQPIGGYWEVENNGAYYPLSDGLDANGSTIFGSQTTTLTITNLELADSTNYVFVATNAYGSVTSPAGTLIVSPQTITITPANPVFYNSNNITLSVNLSPGPPVSLQWYSIDDSANSNNIAGATNSTYFIPLVTTNMNGYTYGVVAVNIYNTNAASVVLAISNSAAFLVGNLAPATGVAYVGAPVTYYVNAQGNWPMYIQWLVDGVAVNGATNFSFTLPAECGTSTVQASFSNALSGGVSVTTATVGLQAESYPTNITFNGNGTGWQTNGTLAIIANNVLELTDGTNGGQASSAFYAVPQYVGGSWTASFTYNSHGGSADGTAFVLQTTNATAVGGGGGQLGYNGIAGNSLAFEINLYPGNNETPGIALAFDGATGVYKTAAPVDTASTNDIYVTLNWANGVLAVSLTDAGTLAHYSTNYTVGPIASVLGDDIAYVGFTGADGGAISYQTVSNFQFQSIIPPVSLSVSPVTGNSIVLSWPTNDANFVLQTNVSLSAPAWGTGPAPVVVLDFGVAELRRQQVLSGRPRGRLGPARSPPARPHRGLPARRRHSLVERTRLHTGESFPVPQHLYAFLGATHAGSRWTHDFALILQSYSAVPRRNPGCSSAGRN